MARLLVKCLGQIGYPVEVASQLRAFLPDPYDETHILTLMTQSRLERQRLTALWERHGPPALWFCYHPYFKSPDLIGPQLCKSFGIPYITAEAAHSPRRNQGVWRAMQEHVLNSINQAAVNLCFTGRDETGLRQASQSAKLAKLPPFIDTGLFDTHKRSEQHKDRESTQLVTVAMMRAGDKFHSYERLAAALSQLVHLPWTLSVIGDGALRDDVQALFDRLPSHRVIWHGLRQPDEIATLLASSSMYVWPGCGEAYGLAYLEAQAAGLPVIAYHTAGVPEVVDNGYSGILTPVADDAAYAAAIASLLINTERRSEMALNAVAHVKNKHSADKAAISLGVILANHLGALNEQ